MFTFMNKPTKTILPIVGLFFLAANGCDEQEPGAAEFAEPELQEAESFEEYADGGDDNDGEFRGVNICHSRCRKAFSSCVSSCASIPGHGFPFARNERCLARCESQLSKCMARCDKPDPGFVTVQGPCFNFNATADGALGGFRVYGAGAEKFHRFNPRTSDRICTGSGKKVRFELGKLLEPGIAVNVTVQGRQFKFPAGDRGDKFLNSWYRKFFNVYVK